MPLPPAFSLDKLLVFEVLSNAPMNFGVDPGTLHITRSDNVLRYVMVASSPSGVKNITYEGIRCATAQVKTYARFSADGRWMPTPDPQGKSLFDNAPSGHALRFARAGACDQDASATSISEIVRSLKQSQQPSHRP